MIFVYDFSYDRKRLSAYLATISNKNYLRNIFERSS